MPHNLFTSLRHKPTPTPHTPCLFLSVAHHYVTRNPNRVTRLIPDTTFVHTGVTMSPRRDNTAPVKPPVQRQLLLGGTSVGAERSGPTGQRPPTGAANPAANAITNTTAAANQPDAKMATKPGSSPSVVSSVARSALGQTAPRAATPLMQRKVDPPVGATTTRRSLVQTPAVAETSTAQTPVVSAAAGNAQNSGQAGAAQVPSQPAQTYSPFNYSPILKVRGWGGYGLHGQRLLSRGY